MFFSPAIVCLILGSFIVGDLAVEARSCKTGGLQCSSEQGNSVDFCSWDPHAWITQDNVICTACNNIMLGGSQGIRCDAVALYNRFDGNALWLKAPMGTEVKDEKAVLTGGVRYELSKKMRLNYLIGQPFGVNEDKDSHRRAFHRVLLPTGDKAYAAVRVQNCFQLVINGNDANGEPIHFAAQGPTDLINIEEEMLWLGQANIASIEIAAVPHCKIRSQGVIHDQQSSPVVDHVDHGREHRHIPERSFKHEDAMSEFEEDEDSLDERSLGHGLGNRHFGMEDRMHGFLGGRSILHGSDPFGRGRDWESNFVRGGHGDAPSTPKNVAVDKRINKRVLKIGNNRQPKRRKPDDTPAVRKNRGTGAVPKNRHENDGGRDRQNRGGNSKNRRPSDRRQHRESVDDTPAVRKNHGTRAAPQNRRENDADRDRQNRRRNPKNRSPNNRKQHRESVDDTPAVRKNRGTRAVPQNRHEHVADRDRQNRRRNSNNRRPNDRQPYYDSVDDDDELHTSEDIVDDDYGHNSRVSRSRDHRRPHASVDDDYEDIPERPRQSRNRRRPPENSGNNVRERRDPRAQKRRRQANHGDRRATRQEMELSYDD